MKPYFYLYFVVLILFCLVNPFVGAAQNRYALDRTFNYGLPTDSVFRNYGGYNTITKCKLQPDGKTLVAGNFYNFRGTNIRRLARLNVDGSLDTSFNCGFGPMWWDSDGIGISALAVQPDGKILVGGSFKGFNFRTYNGIVRLNTNGSIDTTFNIGSGFKKDNLVYFVNAISVQPDGKILIGGDFNKYNGTTCNNIVRLHSNGLIDRSFNYLTGFNGPVSVITLRADNKIYVGGRFSTYQGRSESPIIRLLPNGLKDTTFNRTGRNPNWTLLIRCIVEQPDGKVLIGGNSDGYWDPKIIRLNESGSKDSTFRFWPITNNNNFDYDFRGIYDMVLLPSNKLIIIGSFSDILIYNTYGIARLNSNGSTDRTFNNGDYGFQNIRTFEVYSIISKPDGKLFVGGFFNGYNNYPCDGTVQLDTNGVVDRNFDKFLFTEPKGRVNKIAVQADGKILVGGRLNQQNNYVPKNFNRLLTNGALDNSFQIGIGANGPVSEVVEQPDGQILVAGGFTNFNGTNCRQMVRLNPNGSIDNTFSIGNGTSADTGDITINKILLQPDGKILVGGSFNLFNGVLKNGLVRLNSDGSIDNTFNTGTALGNSGEFITDMCLLSSGKVVIGGSFASFNGTPSRNFARLNSDGSIDTTFNVGIGTNGTISTIINLPGNKIIIGGNFNNYDSTNCAALVRLNSNGSFDSTFGFNVWYLTRLTVFKAVFKPTTGKILISGFFTGWQYGPTITEDSYQLFEIDTNSSLFNGESFYVSNYAGALAVQADGKVLVGGDFRFSGSRFVTPIFRLQQGITCPEEQSNLTITGYARLCEGETGVLTSSAPFGNVWSTGDTTRSITVFAGTYARVQQVINGCIVASSSYFIRDGILINYAPEIPFIDYANRDSLIASTDSCTYQWTYNGVVQPFTTRKIPVQGFGEYTVRAISNLGCRSRSSQVFSILSARRLKQLVKLDLYPNPTTGKVNISTSSDADNITVFNSVGKLVYKIKAEENMELDLSQFSKGVYLVQVQSAKGVSTERLVVR